MTASRIKEKKQDKNKSIKKEKRYLNMSPKELLYIEDTLDHLTENKKCCTDLAANIQDASLRTLLQDITAKETQIFNRFYSLLQA